MNCVTIRELIAALQTKNPEARVWVEPSSGMPTGSVLKRLGPFFICTENDNDLLPLGLYAESEEFE